MTAQFKSHSGMTLIELVLAMVITGIAISGLFVVINHTVLHSADPLIIRQATAVAESYLEEILLQQYSDPDGSEVGETRASFDDVDDYDGLNDSGAYDQTGTLIPSLTRFNINVLVSAPLTLTDGVAAKKITVSISGTGLNRLNLIGYKMNY